AAAGEPAAAAAHEDPARQQIAAGQLLHDQLDSGCPYPDILADDVRDVLLALDVEAARVVDLERLGPRERQIQAVGDRFRDRTATGRAHARALDAALPDARHGRRSATPLG